MRTKTVTLAGVDYAIHELPSRKNRAWREKLREKAEPIFALVEQAPGLDLTADNAGAIGQILRQVSQLVLSATDDIVELCFDYSPELKKDKKRIEDEAYDSELVEAFTAILELAFGFFGTVVSRLDQINRG